MNRILAVTRNDLAQVLRDRMAFLFMLIMPVGFTLLFGYAFGGLGRPAADARLALGLLDADGSSLSAALRAQLAANPGLRLVEGLPAAELEAQLARGALAAVLCVPDGYANEARAGSALPLDLLTAPSGSAGPAVQGWVQAAAARMHSAARTARAVQSAGGAYEPALAAWQQPPAALTVQTPGAAAGSSGGLPLRQTAPGMMLQFGLAGLISAAQVLTGERKARCLQRLLAAPLRPWQILAGHALAIFLLVTVQFGLLMVFGQLVLGLDYLAYPLAALAMALASALFVAALGLLIGVLARSDEQAIIFAMLPMFLFSGLGGAWMPLENTSAAFQAAGHLTPVAWAMDGFKAILAGTPQLLPAAVLLAYAALFFALAAWRFRAAE